MREADITRRSLTAEHASRHSSIYTALLKSGKCAESDLQRALTLSDADGIRFDRALLNLGVIDERALLQLLAAEVGATFLDEPGAVPIDDHVFRQLGKEYLLLNHIVPLESHDSDVVIVTSDPMNAMIQKEVEYCIESSVKWLVATSTWVRRSISQHLDSQSDRPVIVETRDQDQRLLQESSLDGPVIRYVAEQLSDAVEAGASDIHFSSTPHHFSVRLRVNGGLVALKVPGDINATSVFSRLKLLAGMNVAERRRPQDGRIASVIAGRKIDFRVSMVPVQNGESIVCRILDPNALKLGWSDLGFSPEIASSIEGIIRNPNGLFLITGPTGSGKTTTLYTALHSLVAERLKIMTVEDPIEYEIDGVEQIQVNDEIGLDFSSALQSILRQDPNIVMVGEIRNRETAEMACRTALIGRMVLSTLHTNSPQGAVMRLGNLGIDRFLVEDVLRGVLGQKLMTNACRICDGLGCQVCGGSGLGPRTLVTELIHEF